MNKPLRSGAGGLFGSGPRIQSDNLKSDDIVEINLAVAEGPIVGLADGPKSFYLGETPLLSPSGDLNFNKFELHNYLGADTATEVGNVLGGISSNVGVGVNLAYQTEVVRVSPSTLQNQIDVLELRMVFNQVYFQDNRGRVKETPVTLFIEFREVGQGTWQPWFGDTREWTKSLKVSQGTVQEFARQVPRTNNDWEVRVSLQTESLTNEDDNTYEVDVTWESLQAVTAGNRSYDNLSVIRILSEASDQFSGIPEFSGVFHGKIFKIPSNYDPVTRYYDGTWDGSFKDGFTDNPAWCLYNLLTNEVYGAKAYQPNLLADRYSFYEAAQWCDELVERPQGGYQPRYTYNDIIQEQRDGRKMLHYIAGIFGGQLVEDASGLVSVVVDRPGSMVQIIGPESVSEEGFSYNYTDVETRPNFYEVVFTNPDLDWQDDVRTVSIPEFITKHGRTSRQHITVGCIDVFEAQRRAYIRLLRANTETLTVQFKIPRQALLLNVYDLIGITDPDMRWGLSGRIVEINGSIITLRDPITVPVGQQMTMAIQTLSGVHEMTVVSFSAYTTQLQVILNPVTGPLPDRAQFTLQEDSLGLAKPFRVLNIEEDGSDPSLFIVSALEFNPNKFGDAETLSYSGTIDYSSDFAVTPTPRNVRADSGTIHLVQHPDGRIESRIQVVWEQDIPGPVEVLYRRLETDEGDVLKASGRSAYIRDAIDGEEYEIEVRLEGGPIAAAITHTVVGKTALPAKVTGWQISAGITTVDLQGVPFPEADFDFFRIYGGTLSDTFEQAILLEETSSTTYIRPVPEGDTIEQYWITAVDTSRNEGPPSDPLTLTGEEPISPQNFWNEVVTRVAQEDFDFAKQNFDFIFDEILAYGIAERVSRVVEDARLQGVLEQTRVDLNAQIAESNAQIEQILTTAVTDREAVAQLETTLTTSIGDVQGQVSTLQTSLSTLDSQFSQYQTIVSGQFANQTTYIEENLYTIIEADQAIAAATQVVQTNVDGVSTTVSQVSSSLNGVLGQWAIRISNQGVISGISLISEAVNNVPESTMIFDADNFYIGTSDQFGQFQPAFYSTAGGVFLNIARIEDLSVGTLKIADNAVSFGVASEGGPLGGGSSGWLDATSVFISLGTNGRADVELKWYIDQGYANDGESFDVRLVRGTSAMWTRLNMTATEDLPNSFYTRYNEIGDRTYKLQWRGSSSNINVIRTRLEADVSLK